MKKETKPRSLISLKRPLRKVDTKRKYDYILPETGDWPVVQLSRERKKFIEDVTEECFLRIKALKPTTNSLVEELETTRYRETLRYKTNSWKIDPEDEEVFWNGVKNRLLDIGSDKALATQYSDEILKDIISRYAEEIAGNFKPSHYKMARRMANFGFARLLNAAKLKGWNAFFKDEYTLQDKIQIVGEIEHLRKLARIGTIVMVPTHFSNLDSITLGWVINELGLPPFIYGAGLNLFNINLFSYFMNSLGAYKVDRRKKNLIYLETLRAYSKLAIQRGCHSLFFPGGQRSRSGKIETRLKLGLLGTAIEAQRANYMLLDQEEGRENKIFVVPVVINYNFVLEAPGLINEYLESSGQERYYVENDEFSTSSRILSFLLKFFTKGSNISLSIGKGMDLFGNYVDDEGKSIDGNGNHISTRDYFLYKGKITHDPQREEEYTRMLSNIIVKEYHRINQVLPGHLAPFVAFQILRKRYHKLDIFSFLRLPVEEIEINYDEYKQVFEQLRGKIFDLYNQNKIDISPALTGDVDKVITDGVNNVGMYHSRRPLIFNKKGNIATQDLSILHYYQNRMEGYELEKYI